jgi:nicotinamidase/pyrazinamidase
MRAIGHQNSTGTLNGLEEYDAEECQSSETTWLQVAWQSAESWEPPLQLGPSEVVSCRRPGKERAGPLVVVEAALVARTNDYIEGHYAGNLSLELVVDTLPVDSIRLGRLVKQSSEMDFYDYIASVRVENAKNLLLNLNYYFMEIASELGFESIGQFNQSFTRTVGEPSHAYRARLPDGSTSTRSRVSVTSGVRTPNLNTGRRKIGLAAGDALIVVDVQNDFLPGGSLPVPTSDAVIPMLNRYLVEFAENHLPVFATRDWHPPNHCSFRTQGGCWPVHCVADSKGAAFASDLILPPWTVFISKGADAAKEAYSGFDGTDLEKRLRGFGPRRLFIGGLVTDYCVLNTVKDALALGFSVFLLRDANAIDAVNVSPGDGRDAEAEMLRLGAVPIQFMNLAG